MNVFDIIIAILIGIFAIKGYKNGLIKELGSLAALILGIYICIKFSCFVEELLKDKGGISSEYLPLISYAVTFVGVVIVVLLVANLLDKFVNLIKLKWLNKLAGICFSTIKIILVLGGLFILIIKLNEKFNFLSEVDLDKSLLFNKILAIFEYIFPYVEKLAN